MIEAMAVHKVGAERRGKIVETFRDLMLQTYQAKFGVTMEQAAARQQQVVEEIDKREAEEQC